MSEDYYAVVMAGGGGTRLWPLSRQSRPKQSLRLLSDRTLFQMALDRIEPVIPAERTLVVTVASQVDQLRQQAPRLPGENFVVEPAPRGTASVIGLAAILVESRTPSSIMACLTADHFIGNEDGFRDLLMAAHRLAGEGELVTLGITPSFAATAYGYIRRGELRGSYAGYNAYRLLSFEEKPEVSKAEAYLATGEYMWNSGMFVWKARRILGEIERLMPELDEGLKAIAGSLGGPEEKRMIDEVWRRLESQTIDYGVMERAEGASVIEADDLSWMDIGNWDRMFEVMSVDADGNILRGEGILTFDTRGTLVFQDGGVSAERLIATLGLEDMIVVDTGDVLFICSRERVEDVRLLVGELREKGLSKYL